MEFSLHGVKPTVQMGPVLSKEKSHLAVAQKEKDSGNKLFVQAACGCFNCPCQNPSADYANWAGCGGNRSNGVMHE